MVGRNDSPCSWNILRTASEIRSALRKWGPAAGEHGIASSPFLTRSGPVRCLHPARFPRLAAAGRRRSTPRAFRTDPTPTTHAPTGRGSPPGSSPPRCTPRPAPRSRRQATLAGSRRRHQRRPCVLRPRHQDVRRRSRSVLRGLLLGGTHQPRLGRRALRTTLRAPDERPAAPRKGDAGQPPRTRVRRDAPPGLAPGARAHAEPLPLPPARPPHVHGVHQARRGGGGERHHRLRPGLLPRQVPPHRGRRDARLDRVFRRRLRHRPRPVRSRREHGEGQGVAAPRPRTHLLDAQPGGQRDVRVQRGTHRDARQGPEEPGRALQLEGTGGVQHRRTAGGSGQGGASGRIPSS